MLYGGASAAWRRLTTFTIESSGHAAKDHNGATKYFTCAQLVEFCCSSCTRLMQNTTAISRDPKASKQASLMVDLDSPPQAPLHKIPVVITRSSHRSSHWYCGTAESTCQEGRRISRCSSGLLCLNCVCTLSLCISWRLSSVHLNSEDAASVILEVLHAV